MSPSVSKPLPGRIPTLLALAAAAALALPAFPAAAGDDVPPAARYVPPRPEPPRGDGAIFSASHYRPLIGGERASAPGDLLTIVLVENTRASKSNSANVGKSGGFSIIPPVTGPLSLFDPTDVAASGAFDFDGAGSAAQSNNLAGEVTVIVTDVFANGVMRVAGKKLITLNRGDELIEFTGLVRKADVSEDNRIASTRVANAEIKYYGEGEIARASKQGWLSRFFSWINPF